MKLLKLGTVCLDGTKLHANTSRHSALLHGHIEKLEVQLKAEVQELLALAEQAEYDGKMACRVAKEKDSGKKPGGKLPKAPEPGPKDCDQLNLTDEKSRIMPVSGGGFNKPTTPRQQLTPRRCRWLLRG